MFKKPFALAVGGCLAPVYGPVHLHCKLLFVAVEVHDESTYGMLSPELPSVKPSAAEGTPEQRLANRGIRSQRACCLPQPAALLMRDSKCVVHGTQSANAAR